MSFYTEVFLYHGLLALLPALSLACDLCGRAVRIEAAALTCEYGQAVHSVCYRTAVNGLGQRV